MSDNKTLATYSISPNKSNSSENKVKLYISNIKSEISYEELKSQIELFGEVKEIYINRKNDIYFAIVIMTDKFCAEKALFEMKKKFGWTINIISNKYDYDNLDNLNIKKSRSRSKERSNKSNKSSNNGYEILIQIQNYQGLIDFDLIYNNFFYFGEIVNIDLSNPCSIRVFFRFKSSIRNINEKGKIIKIVIGGKEYICFIVIGEIQSESNEELNENNCKLVCGLFVKNNNFIDLYYKNILASFGEIKAFCIKKLENTNKSILYADYVKTIDAIKVVNYYKEGDMNTIIEKKRAFQDANIIIDFYFKLKECNLIPLNNTISNQNFNLNNNIGNNNLLQFQNQRNFYNPQYLQLLKISNPQQYNLIVNQLIQQQKYLQMLHLQNKHSQQNQNIPNHNINSNIRSPSIINPQQQILKNSNIYQSTNISESQSAQTQLRQPNNITINVFSVKEKDENKITTPYNQTSNQIHRQFIGEIYNPYENMIKENNNNLDKSDQDKLKEFISHLANKKNQSNFDTKSEITDTLSIPDDVFGRDYNLEEENLKHLWSGFFTRSGKLKVGVDIFQLRYDCSDYLHDFNYNITHKLSFEEILRKPILGIVAISPQNETQLENFDEYLNYFNEKQKAGVVTMRNNNCMYIISNGEFSRKFYLNNDKKHLIGIIQNSITENLSTFISLPPPVMSLNEKRRKSKKPLSMTDELIKNTASNLISFEIPDENEIKELFKNLKGDDYINQLSQLTKNLDNYDKLQELIKNPKLIEILNNPIIQKWLNKQ